MQAQHAILEQPTEQHLVVLESWWTSRREVLEWGGPLFRFPFDPERGSFRQDLRLQEVTSRVLLSDGELAAFGQYYPFHGRVHLARLASAPELRGRGWGARLVRALVDEGRQRLGLEEASLYVKATNRPAVRCYQRQGFVVAEPPKDLRMTLPGMEDVLFMVSSPHAPLLA